MTDLFTCRCGNQTWQIFDKGVRCTACQAEFATPHAPVAEFNHIISEELEEVME